MSSSNNKTSPDVLEAGSASAPNESNSEQGMQPMSVESSVAPTADTPDNKKWNLIPSFMFNAVKKFEEDEEQNNHAPRLPYLELFRIFLWFGCRAFGGPVAQIAMMKDELVNELKWTTAERFNRVYAVYQVLPGPEATELACYFGYLSRGRIGSLLGGLGFLLPGFLMMLLWSFIYVEYGLENRHVQSSFHCIQIVISSFIFRATYKLAESALNHRDPTTKQLIFSWQKGFLCLFCFLTSAIGLNFFISLAVSGVMNALFSSKIKYTDYVSYFIGAATIGFYILYVAENGIPSGDMIGGNLGSSGSTSYSSLFELGLIAGMVTFGGAYTTLPFIYTVAVQHGHWLTQQQFLDALAITNVLPTPLVTFVTMVGWVGHGVGGAIVITLGIFLPALSFTFIGHEYFELVVENRVVEPFLDGVASAVIGLLALTAFQFLKSTLSTGIDAVVFLLSFCALFHFTDKYTQPIIIIVAAIAGQVLYG